MSGGECASLSKTAGNARGDKLKHDRASGPGLADGSVVWWSAVREGGLCVIFWVVAGGCDWVTSYGISCAMCELRNVEVTP